MAEKSLTLRIPEEIHKKLKIMAAIHESTMTDIIIHIVELEPVELEYPSLLKETKSKFITEPEPGRPKTKGVK